MRALKVLVVVMGVLIVLGVAVLVATLVTRMGGALAPGMAQVTLDEPAGTRIAGSTLSADRLALRLQGGGADRVVVVDLKSGKVIGRAGLAQ